MQKWTKYNELTELNISLETLIKKLDKLSVSDDYNTIEYYRIYNNGSIDIVDWADPSRSNRNNTFNVSFGTIIGTNLGEWGGELFFRSDYGIKTYTIIRDNVVEIFMYKGDIYVLTGLSHLRSSRGKIIRLKYSEEIWVVDLTIDLESCPSSQTIFDDCLYILTEDGITIFDGNNAKKIISGKLETWRYLEPKTIYINNEIIAVGLRGCIAIVDKKDNNIKYYKRRYFA
jgi:hypothetical protein